MSNDRDGSDVETVYDRGDGDRDVDREVNRLSEWMVERWKSEQRKSTPTEKPPGSWRVGDEVRNAAGVAHGYEYEDEEEEGEQGPFARGSSPSLPLPGRTPLNDEAIEKALAIGLAHMQDAMAAEADGDDGDAEVPAVSRKVKSRPRHRRRERPRSKTIAMKRLTREALRAGAIANPPVEGVERPQTRAECRDAPRPCPWVACKHHLYLDINPKTGSIKINFPELEPWELEHTCALDVADNGGLTLEEIGLITNLTRERVRQVEVRGLLTLKARSASLK
jgi:hypothetical protein